VTEEAMETGPMAIGDIAAREDDVCDESATVRQNPTARNLHKRLKGRDGENWSKDL
jgi:hypothetical protein